MVQHLINKNHRKIAQRNREEEILKEIVITCPITERYVFSV